MNFIDSIKLMHKARLTFNHSVWFSMLFICRCESIVGIWDFTISKVQRGVTTSNIKLFALFYFPQYANG